MLHALSTDLQAAIFAACDLPDLVAVHGAAKALRPACEAPLAAQLRRRFGAAARRQAPVLAALEGPGAAPASSTYATLRRLRLAARRAAAALRRDASRLTVKAHTGDPTDPSVTRLLALARRSRPLIECDQARLAAARALLHGATAACLEMRLRRATAAADGDAGILTHVLLDALDRACDARARLAHEPSRQRQMALTASECLRTLVALLANGADPAAAQRKALQARLAAPAAAPSPSPLSLPPPLPPL